MVNFQYVLIAKGYYIEYENSEYSFEHLSVKCDGYYLGSWDAGWSERFHIGIL